MKNQGDTIPVFLPGILERYNPWWENGSMALLAPPAFKRPVFERLYAAVKAGRAIISLTGPRRIGKTVLLRQLIQNLLGEGINPQNIKYFSLDDPVTAAVEPNSFFDYITQRPGEETDELQYIFLDEVQAFPRWELFLKREFDLNAPRRYVISGSAATPIFRASRESLLGRITDYHLAPFSFLEYILYQTFEAVGDPSPAETIRRIVNERDKKEYDLTPENIIRIWERQHKNVDEFYVMREFEEEYFEKYLLAGGFPGVWSLVDPVARTEYLVENHIKKVVREDLARVSGIRKTSDIERLLYYFLTNPGAEVNLTRLAGDLENVTRTTLNKYVELITQTELIFKNARFSKRPFKARSGNFKFYLADHSITNGLLKITNFNDINPRIRGYYDENVVYNLLRRIRGITGVSYYRDGNGREVDLIIELGIEKPIPVEVKRSFDHSKDKSILKNINYFIEKFKIPFGIIIGGSDCVRQGRIVAVPLTWFLSWFDPCY